ncbi:MAG: type II toxin-antitoxin system RelE/ParE family toxin [Lachnospiraceae bacterium]|nr:type II toxin-antitoxin system RelE/ParE family toxin [Lachnospiraceae bacterium]
MPGGNGLKKYKVVVSPRAAEDIDSIYCYIADEFKDIGAAEKLADKLHDAVTGLSTMPRRGSLRKTGAFANKGYRQLQVGNFTIVYRIDEERNLVIMVTVRYSRSSF